MAARTTVTSYYRYLISAFDILIPNIDPIPVLAGNINAVSIEKDFDNDFFPILYVNLNLPPDVYYQIMTNKTTVKFRIRMDKYIYEKNQTSKFKQLVFNESFSMFTDNNSPFLDDELYKKTKDISGGSTQLNDFKNTYDFYLFKDKDMLSSKKVINTVISSGSMVNIISYLLSSAGFSNILMTPFDNNAGYSEVILLPQSILANINYLDRQYGFYNYGKLVFFDYNTTYFISKRAACTAYRTNEYQDVLVVCNKSANPNSLTPGNFKDDKQKCYILNITKDNVTLLTTSIVSDQLEGNKIISVSPSTGGVNNINPAVQQRGSGSQQLIVNNYNNQYTNKSLEYRKLENDNVLDVKFSDVDIDCIVPNKRFIFSFEDTSVQKTNGGDYRLANAIFGFKKEGTEFSITGTAEFKKLK